MFSQGIGRTIAMVVYGLLLLFMLYGIFVGMRQMGRVEGVREPFTNFMIGFWFTIFITKLVFAIGLFLQDGGRLIIGLVNAIREMSGGDVHGDMIPSRRKFITLTAAGIASVPFLSMIYGITKGKYNYKIESLDLVFDDLPDAFDGFKIAQITDIHSGSWDSVERVKEGVRKIMSTESDMIVFTGDLVNFNKDEIDPYIDTLSTLNAPHGVHSILGNHDYYGARNYKSQNGESYITAISDKHKAMGWNLLRNEHTIIQKENKQLVLAGVENWGYGPFPKEGDLDKALEGVKENDFTVLLSHDPTHWTHHTLPHKKHVHLTLSGHTHGMQFGIKIPGFKWSPVQYRYKYWLGLYEEAKQYLYVNPGFGFLGFPGRVGMWPEITVFTLRKG